MFWFNKQSKIDKIRGIKKIKIQGIIFKIKKLSPLEHVTGAKVMLSIYDKYQTAKDKQVISDGQYKKVKQHYCDVFMSSVAEPLLTRKQDGVGVWVEEVFQNWELASALYDEINLHTYGKKKIQQLS